MVEDYCPIFPSPSASFTLLHVMEIALRFEPDINSQSSATRVHVPQTVDLAAWVLRKVRMHS
jgi:hypothetical protein